MCRNDIGGKHCFIEAVINHDPTVLVLFCDKITVNMSCFTRVLCNLPRRCDFASVKSGLGGAMLLAS